MQPSAAFEKKVIAASGLGGPVAATTSGFRVEPGRSDYLTVVGQ